MGRHWQQRRSGTPEVPVPALPLTIDNWDYVIDTGLVLGYTAPGAIACNLDLYQSDNLVTPVQTITNETLGPGSSTYTFGAFTGTPGQDYLVRISKPGYADLWSGPATWPA